MHVLAVGAAAPAHRLPAGEVAAAWGRKGGRGQASVCAADEDVLTLAAEAAGRAIAASGLQTDIVDGLWWGTSRPPFAEGPSHAVLAATIGLSAKSGGALCSGSPHAGMEALLGAADAVGAGSARVALVVVSDALVPGPGTTFEQRSGAGAAAIVLVADGGAASLGARVTRTHPFLGQYRGDGESDDARHLRRSPVPGRGLPPDHARCRRAARRPRRARVVPPGSRRPPRDHSRQAARRGNARVGRRLYRARRHRRRGSAARRDRRTRRQRERRADRLRRRSRHRRRPVRRSRGAGRGQRRARS